MGIAHDHPGGFFHFLVIHSLSPQSKIRAFVSILPDFYKEARESLRIFLPDTL